MVLDALREILYWAKLRVWLHAVADLNGLAVLDERVAEIVIDLLVYVDTLGWSGWSRNGLI